MREEATMASVQCMLEIYEREAEKMEEPERWSNKGIFDPVVWEETRECRSEENWNEEPLQMSSVWQELVGTSKGIASCFLACAASEETEL